MKKLGIIIPAYKQQYFAQALDSLVEQTSKDFSVYIGDDNSPHDLKAIVDNYSDALDINFIKFENNIGSENLVKQWERCITLSKDEEWLWLFSDDDIADKDAVKNFFLTMEKNKNRFDVYRFNTTIIDGEGNIIAESPVGPSEESSAEMAYNLLLGKRGNSMPDHIFSRKVYNECGGFVHTRYAQGADWATSILFSSNKGICIIPQSKLYWRYSGVNISSLAQKNTSKMLIGHIQFIEWILLHFKNNSNGSSVITFEMIRKAAEFNLINVITHHYKKLTGRNILRVFFLLRNEFGYSIKYSLKKILLIKENTSNRYYRITSFINKYLRSKNL